VPGAASIAGFTDAAGADAGRSRGGRAVIGRGARIAPASKSQPQAHTDAEPGLRSRQFGHSFAAMAG